MCGIAAVFGDIGKEALAGQLRSLLERMYHRGFRHFETVVGPRWSLGANRLPILDRANGAQPSVSDDGRFLAVLNGEIYNHQVLRRELQALGRRFSTVVDTEVVATGFAEWGMDLFPRLDGMFAVVVVDQIEHRVIAARDPMGIKPLYIARSTARIRVASEIKALRDADSTIKELPPGTLLTLDELHPRSYRPECPTNQPTGTFAENAQHFRTLFSNAVRKRVQTDLPIAVFLSGGIDSSAVLYEAIQHNAKITAFVIGRPQALDVVSAQLLCDELNVPLVRVDATEGQLLDLIPETVWTIESFEPNHIRGGTLSYLLAREVSRRGFKIALCGEGADELLGGYDEITSAAADPGELERLLHTFVNQLHRTQLQRVDRTAMRFTLEVRVPFLDMAVVDFVTQLPAHQKVHLDASRREVVGKHLLREAYRGSLPNQIVDRRKAVLSYGAGFSSNGPEGPFFEHAKAMISVPETAYLQDQYPGFGINSTEEAYYFSLFLSRIGPLEMAQKRPTVNRTAVAQS